MDNKQLYELHKELEDAQIEVSDMHHIFEGFSLTKEESLEIGLEHAREGKVRPLPFNLQDDCEDIEDV